MQTINLTTTQNKQIIDITDQVNQALQQQEVLSGLCGLALTHTTAALTTADLDPGTDQDLLDAFEEMIPKLNYRHPHDPGHVSDHINSALIGTAITLPFQNKKLILGTWQRAILIDFNGPRERQIVLTVISE